MLAASYGGVRGHPLALLAARPGRGSPTTAAGKLLDALLVACDDLTPPGDVDTPEQLAQRL